MFAIAGVSGHTGSVVASTLLAAGKPVRVIVRDAAKGAPWKARGAEVAVASLDDRAALAAALAGIEGAYLLVPPNGFGETGIPANRARTTAAILGAVTDAKPGHVVFLSSIGAQHVDGTGPIKYLKPVEDGLRASGVPSTFLRASFFMENWGDMAKGAIDSGALYYALDRSIPMVATGDIGKTAAKLLLEGAPRQARVVNIAGPVDQSLEDVAAALAKISGKPVKAVAVPPSALVEALVGMGASREIAASYGEMSAGMDKLTWEGDLTRGTITVEQRLRELLA
jgi:uncharacterized protein YbjT (DUF2867 family)